MLEERVAEVLARYPLEIQRSYRMRGAYVLETRQGLYLYRNYSGSEMRAGQEAAIQQCLMDRGFERVDRYLANTEGEFLGIDAMGEAHVVKRWFQGEECNLREPAEVELAAETLAELHQAMKRMKGALPFEARCRQVSIEEQQGRHLRELQRIRTYIRGKRERNPLELLLLQSLDRYYEQGEEALAFLGEHKPKELEREAEEEGHFFHGNYSYHSLLLQESEMAVIQFERSGPGIQLADLYYLMRKALEKNEWLPEIGERILKSYQKRIALSFQERQILYGMLYFPEKYWKIANGYFNGKKSRIPGRNRIKLEEFLHQEGVRSSFLQQVDIFQ